MYFFTTTILLFVALCTTQIPRSDRGKKAMFSYVFILIATQTPTDLDFYPPGFTFTNPTTKKVPNNGPATRKTLCDPLAGLPPRVPLFACGYFTIFLKIVLSRPRCFLG